MIESEGFEILDDEECRWLLAQERVGRVALSMGALPAVFPVNYAVVSDEIMFFTGEGTKLRAALTNTVLAFEVDHVDPFHETGWSVLVVGVTREITEPVIVAGARASGLRPWADGDRPHLIGLTIEFLSGRRIAGSTDLRDGHVERALGLVGPHAAVAALARPPVRVAAHASLRVAAQAMREANVSSVLIYPDTAILTERDLTRAVNTGLSLDTDASLVGAGDLVTVDQDATVVEAAGEMLRHEIRHLVVCNHRGEVIGLVSLRDIIGVLLDAMDPAVWVMLRSSMSVASVW